MDQRRGVEEMKEVRAWRISCDAQGAHMYFDPVTEVPMVRDLTPEEKADILDRMSSVSALDEDEGETSDLVGYQRNLFPVGIPHGT